MRLVVGVATLLVATSLLAVDRSTAAPQPGERFPDVTAQDVTGTSRHIDSLVDGPTLLVAIANRHAGDKMQAWFDAADVRFPNVNRISIISIGAPFFVSDGYARGKARERVPREWWHSTLFDADHELANELDLQHDQTPYVFVLDGGSRVVALVHGTVKDRRAGQIWRALEQLKRP